MLTAAPRVVLATLNPDGSPHLVPIVLAEDDEYLTFVVDDKPKTTYRLRRIENLRRDSRCSLLADRYDDDWSKLWWVRLDGVANVYDDARTVRRLAAKVAERYPQSSALVPGPAVHITPERWHGWAAEGDLPPPPTTT